MKLIFILGLILIPQMGISQISEIKPSTIKLLDLTVQGEEEFNKNRAAAQQVLVKMRRLGVEFGELSQEDQQIYMKDPETMGSYWDILGGGCSWYCGGGPKDITASSYLKQQGGMDYTPLNIHDSDYKHVWAEGVDGDGIGEYILYTFSGASPRINEIIVVNGYVKSKTAWENNSRVKKLKVYVNDKPYVILHLQDSRSSQHFRVDPIGNGDREDTDALLAKPDWTLKFEILDVYKGLKYDDTVISEIYFDGLDVH